MWHHLTEVESVFYFEEQMILTTLNSIFPDGDESVCHHLTEVESVKPNVKQAIEGVEDEQQDDQPDNNLMVHNQRSAFKGLL